MNCDMEVLTKMKIVTVNISETMIESIEKLVGDEGLYPSRSELIRVATRDFLLRELKMADTMAKHKEEEPEGLDDENFVRVPVERLNDKNEPIREFRTYKIIKKLSYDNQEQPKEDHGDFTWKLEFNQTYDDIPLPSNYVPPRLNELRRIYPNEPFVKFINEW